MSSNNPVQSTSGRASPPKLNINTGPGSTMRPPVPPVPPVPPRPGAGSTSRPGVNPLTGSPMSMAASPVSPYATATSRSSSRATSPVGKSTSSGKAPDQANRGGAVHFPSTSTSGHRGGPTTSTSNSHHQGGNSSPTSGSRGRFVSRPIPQDRIQASFAHVKENRPGCQVVVPTGTPSMFDHKNPILNDDFEPICDTCGAPLHYCERSGHFQFPIWLVLKWMAQKQKGKQRA